MGTSAADAREIGTQYPLKKMMNVAAGGNMTGFFLRDLPRMKRESPRLNGGNLITFAHLFVSSVALDESLDIGMDTRTPVDDSYKLPFRFTGIIDKLTYKIRHEQLAAEDRKVMQKALAGAHD